MDLKQFISKLGFTPKENTTGIYAKEFYNGYYIDIDFDKKLIDYHEIISDSRTTLNFSQPENFVVLECVDRLLETGYKPQNIILEKTWAAGHGTSGRLDICVTRDDGTEYLLIECKTYGKEFDKAFSHLKKDGGQLFTYFKFSNKADIIMLYASELKGKDIVYRNEIVKIEDDYRIGDAKDFYEKWNKHTKNNGVWENPPYDFQLKKFTKDDLEELTEEKGKRLFHEFAKILRKHSVSDKPNAFNVIFNLFLAKLYDEQKRETEELEFRWRENDDPVDFQVRLYNLHKEGLLDFLKKEIEGIKDEDFDAKLTVEERYKAKKKILKFNKLFDIKSVMDDDDFEQNHRVLKEVVQLIEKYQIRYPRKQKYLSEFFELLLTTGLKQEVGQYFTPPPIAKFIVKSLPLHQMIEQETNNALPKLPAVVDYAVGSGHFVTEIMEEYQDIIKDIDAKKVKYSSAENEIISWQVNPYSWASRYIYGIEKDYRLVKVAKVGCYFYGDGLAQIIHGDGLNSLTNPPKSYIGLLEQNTNSEDSTKNKFSIVVANPPYSVKYCKEDLEYIGSQKDFTLYPFLTDNSNEIECLFVERTKQLLKDGGVAGVILPSSILSNTGIYTKTREIILQNFEIVAITELGNNTFMATGTNTIVLFLRRRNNSDSIKLSEFVEKFFVDFQDNNPPKPFNTIELQQPVTKYVNHVWEGVNLVDYISLIKNMPNENIQNNEFYKTYRKSVEIKIEAEIAKTKKNRKTQLLEDDVQKIKDRVERDYFNNFIETEKEKLLYFILSYNQNVILVKTGKGDDEKRFLGYKFSNSKGNEGMHPIKGKSIDDCTMLYNEKDFEDETKASSYIFKAYNNEYPEIHESLKNNVSCVQLVDMMTFDRVDFEKNISPAIKKKVKIESKWEVKKLGEVLFENDKSNIKVGAAKDLNEGEYPFFTSGETVFKFNDYLVDNQNIYLSTGGNAIVKFYNGKAAYSTDTFVIKSNDENTIKTKFIFYFLENIIPIINEFYFKGVGLKHLQKPDFRNIQIPLPSKDIQEKIVAEIEVLEEKERKAKEGVGKLRTEIEINFKNTNGRLKKLNEVCELKAGDFVKANDINKTFSSELYPCYGGNGLRGYTKTYTNNGQYSLVGRQGALCGNVHLVSGKFHATEHALVAYPKEEVDTMWLHYQLVFMNLNQFATGTAQPGLSVVNLNPIEIPLPPFPEQQRIVSEIEKIEEQINGLEQQLAEIPKMKEEILKKYL